MEITRNKKGEIVDRKAIPPATAPPQIVRVINRANKIRKKPYSYGGGRGPQWWKKLDKIGYDCSGAVSFAVRGLGARFLRSPLTSGGFETWGKEGKGAWLTVYANKNHAYMVVAGLRFDTANNGSNGPRWSASLRSTAGKFTARSPKGF